MIYMPALSWVADDLVVPKLSDAARQFPFGKAERNYGKTALDSALVFAREEGYGPGC